MISSFPKWLSIDDKEHSVLVEDRFRPLSLIYADTAVAVG